MWKVITLRCGQLRIGKISEVGTKESWACLPTCSYAIPASGKFDELDAAILDGSTTVEFSFCQKRAQHRIILEGGPLNFSFDDLVCEEHLPKRESQLEARAQELYELWQQISEEERQELLNS